MSETISWRKVEFIVSMAQVSCFIGGMISGNFADNYGRKKTTIVMTILGLLSAVGMCMSTNWWLYLIFWLSLNLWNHIGYMAISVYSLEILGPSKREWSIFISLAYSMGYLICSPIAYYFPYWRTIVASISVFYITFLPMIYFCPASPTWLMIKGRTDEANDVLRIFSKKTKSEIPNEFYTQLRTSTIKGEKEESSSILELVNSGLFRTATMLISTAFFDRGLNSLPYTVCHIC